MFLPFNGLVQQDFFFIYLKAFYDWFDSLEECLPSYFCLSLIDKPSIFWWKILFHSFSESVFQDYILQQGHSHWGGRQGGYAQKLQFLKQKRSNSFSFKHQDIAFYGYSEIMWTKNFTVFTMYGTIFGLQWLFIFSNYIGEIDHFSLDFLERSDIQCWTFWKVSHCGPSKR